MNVNLIVLNTRRHKGRRVGKNKSQANQLFLKLKLGHRATCNYKGSWGKSQERPVSEPELRLLTALGGRVLEGSRPEAAKGNDNVMNSPGSIQKYI